MSTYFEEAALAQRGSSPGDGDDPYKATLSRVRDQLSQSFLPEQLTNAGPLVTETCQRIAAQVYDDYNQRAIHELRPPVALPRELFLQRVQADLLGMGALEPLLQDESIEDIAVNGPKEVMVYRSQGWEAVPLQFETSERLLELLNRGMAAANRQANVVMPVADAVLPGRERVSVVTHPVSDPWPAAVIRAPRARGINLIDMVRPDPAAAGENAGRISGRSTGPQPVHPDQIMAYYGAHPGAMLSPQAAAYLHAAVLAGLNIAVIGPTGVGKTTLLAALGRQIPTGQRILIIEDTPEIVLYPGADRPHNVINLRTRPPSLEETPAISQEELVKLALRQRPDALTLGEARGAEVFDLLTALNTGHKNGLTSLHAYGEEELFHRVYLMLHIVIAMELVRHGGRGIRRVRTIAECTGRVQAFTNFAEPEMQVMFRYNGTVQGKLEGPCNASVFTNLFLLSGISPEIFTPGP